MEPSLHVMATIVFCQLISVTFLFGMIDDMPRIRDIVATELANQQIHHNHFLARPERSSIDKLIDTQSAGNSSKRSHIENACSDSDFEDIRKPGTKRKKIKQAIERFPS